MDADKNPDQVFSVNTDQFFLYKSVIHISVSSQVCSTFIKESEGNNEAGYEGISHLVLADAFVLSSGEMKDVFNKEKENPHDSELQKPEGLSVCLTESEKALPAVIDQVSVFVYI